MRTFFAQFLRHSTGQWAGKPFELQPWQWDDVIRPLFGWRRADGTRRFRRAYIEIPKKNGKSTLCAGLALYLLIADGEPGAEVYSAASDRDQAGIVFRECEAMVRASTDLAKRLDVIASRKRITFVQTNSYYQALSADTRTAEGRKIHGLIFDELHTQKTRDMWDALTYGGAARRQPLLVAITTAGYDRATICYEQHQYARGILDGTTVDPAFFAYIRSADLEDDWTDPEVWRKANPSLGVTIEESSFADDFREAVNSPAKENSFRRYRLNQWTTADVRWISHERWAACDKPIEDLAGAECYAGLDLSSTLDTTSLVLLFPHADGTHSVLPYIWVPESACRDRERKNRQQFGEWVRRGHMLETTGDVVDYAVIRNTILDLAQRYQLRELAYDPWNATALATQLQADGIACVQFRQGFASFSEPTKEFEALILKRAIRHGGHPALSWMAANTAVEMDAAGNLKPSKKKSTEKIDAVVAAIMALGLARAHKQDGAPTISWM